MREAIRMPWLYYECLLDIAEAYAQWAGLVAPIQALRYYWAITGEEVTGRLASLSRRWDA